MKLVLFDCDGTLVDSAGLIHAVMSETFADFGKPRPDISETKAIIGLTLDIAIARMLGAEAAYGLVFVMMIIVLVVRPAGLLGRA